VRFGRRWAAQSEAGPPAAKATGGKRAGRKPAGAPRAAKAPLKRRPPAYFLVAGIRLDQEMDRLRELPVFAGGPLERRPELKVRRASTRPNRVGFAVPTEHRLQVTAYPGARAGDVLETLLH
jgi:hypothetical protein